MRKGDWQQVHSGRQFWPLDPHVEDIDIDDIAHALSNQCRFGGHVRTFYSVAQHSVYVSYVCEPKDSLWGLLHDATEAYLVDVPTPVKRHLLEYGPIEERLQGVIANRFGLTEGMPPSVHRADALLLATEARDLMSRPPAPWPGAVKPASFRIGARPPTQAKAMFLQRFQELTK